MGGRLLTAAVADLPSSVELVQLAAWVTLTAVPCRRTELRCPGLEACMALQSRILEFWLQLLSHLLECSKIPLLHKRRRLAAAIDLTCILDGHDQSTVFGDVHTCTGIQAPEPWSLNQVLVGLPLQPAAACGH